MSKPLHRRLPIIAVFSWALLAAPLGCGSRAHSDLYQQRMAGEIRVLEDQLYEADYHNRVLHDELQRAKIQASQIPIHTTAPSTSEVRPKPDSPPRRRRDEAERQREETEDDMGEGLESTDDLEEMGDLELPRLDEGEPVEPDALNEPLVPEVPLLPGEADPGKDRPPSELLPPPGGPEPPSKNDIQVPPILPGEVLPPPTSEDDDSKPPGQIELPDSVQAIEGVPDQLRIHPALSGGHRVDGSLEGMMVVINVVDRLGKTIDLKSFDVDAELSIVILDPLLDPSEARLGRWNFSSRQVSSLVRGKPISGLHVPIEWQESEPTGEEVIVHVRLRSQEDEMRCERRLKVEKQAAVAEWTPRGESIR